MHQYVKLMADRNDTSMNDVVRQAIREHLDIQEDLITSRSRLGRTVMRELGKMHQQIMGQLAYLTKLVLAAVIIQMTHEGHQTGDVTRRIVALANEPALNKMLTSRQS
jgi:hypothetical protein